MAHQLDDKDFVLRNDPKEMYRLTWEFPEQCQQALGISRDAELPDNFAMQAKLAMLTGLGGSAAGGDLVRALFEEHGAVPFMVNRDYSLPNYVGLGDLVICASYSGNTEETLSAYEHAKSLGAKVLAVTSGGTLAAKAGEDENPVITIPGGQPPRTALGFMLMPVLVTAERLKLLPEMDFEAALDVLKKCREDWGVDKPFEENEAKQLAQAMHGKLAVLYGLGPWQGLIANRWKGQINENAKNMAFANSFPELNHNEILGWVLADQQGVERWVSVVLESGEESRKMQTRANVTCRLIEEHCESHTARARGNTLLERMLSLTYLGDFVSLYLAALNGVDPENIDWINELKGELAKVD
jgi:glucose/mannose-6-phosphate isomerase